MHIYAFGSVCRGDISPDSDVDLLAVVQGHDSRINPVDYSIYSYSRVKEIWHQGNPFAWHLSLESKLLFSSDQTDFLASLGKPQPYRGARQDCEKFFSLFREARASFVSSVETRIFDLSMVFLAIRNFATCFSLGFLKKPNFSRNSVYGLGDYSLFLPLDAYGVLQRARILCARAVGDSVTDEEAEFAAAQFSQIEKWMKSLLTEIRDHAARVQ